MRPRLVPLEPRPIELEDGTRAVVLRDPMGILENAAIVSPAAYWVLAHFDGSRELPDVVRALGEAGVRIRLSDVERVATQAREAGLVHGPAYRSRRAEALAAFRARPRAPACAGGAYPAEETALREMLAGFYTERGGPGPRDPRSRVGEHVRLLVAPHIDFRRGGASYAHAYGALEGCDADLFVVFGTAHASPPHLYTLTRQDYATPLGTVATDHEVVNALAAELTEEDLFADELVHAGEHSCEFQMVWLRWVLGDRPFRGRKVCFVAGADLAHVGPQYGDPRSPTPEELAGYAAQDRQTLGFVAGADAAAFHRDATADAERRRLCGVAPIYAAMRAAGRGARLLHYGQWTDGTDMVSFAAAAG
jgi:predicted class III extradiol MEMO1 family dioxygenase